MCSRLFCYVIAMVSSEEEFQILYISVNFSATLQAFVATTILLGIDHFCLFYLTIPRQHAANWVSHKGSEKLNVVHCSIHADLFECNLPFIVLM